MSNTETEEKKSDEDRRPVLIVSEKGYLVHVGDPATFDKKLLVDYAQKGYKIQTITIKQYRAKQWKWYWEKEKKVSA